METHVKQRRPSEVQGINSHTDKPTGIAEGGVLHVRESRFPFAECL
jgi:hypothetical protein